MLLHRLNVLHLCVSPVRKQAFFCNSHPPYDIEREQKIWEGLSHYNDISIKVKTSQAAKDLGFDIPDFDFFDCQPFDNYSMESIEEIDKDFCIEFGPSAIANVTYFYKSRKNMELQADINSTHSILWHKLAKPDPY
jgi:hypothetical protein